MKPIQRMCRQTTMTTNEQSSIGYYGNLLMRRERDICWLRQAAQPPSTGNATPVINAAPGEQR